MTGFFDSYNQSHLVREDLKIVAISIYLKIYFCIIELD